MSAITTPSPVRGKRHCTCNKISILCPRIDRLARPFRSRPLEPLMSLHRLTSITVGVPNVEETAAYYADFGLRPTGTSPDGAVRFATRDGGEQLGIVPASRRKLVRIGIGAHDADDIGLLRSSLARLDVACQTTDNALRVVDPGSALQVTVSVAPEVIEQPAAPEPTNGPGRADRPNGRAPAVERENPVQPRKLGHVVIGSGDRAPPHRVFGGGVGVKINSAGPR